MCFWAWAPFFWVGENPELALRGAEEDAAGEEEGGIPRRGSTHIFHAKGLL